MTKPFVTTIRMTLPQRAAFDVVRNQRAEQNGGTRPSMQDLLEECVSTFLAAEAKPKRNRSSVAAEQQAVSNH